MLIGTGFAGIFYDNCRRNGLAAITVEASLRDTLLELASNAESSEMMVSIKDQIIKHARGTDSFALPSDIRDDLLAGRDAIAVTLEKEDEIKAFEESYWKGNKV